MTQRNRALPGVSIVPFHFMQDAVAASQSAVALAPVELADPSSGNAGTALVGYAMPTAFEVIAVTATLSAAGSAGNLSAAATIGGTADTDSTVAITTEAAKTKTLVRDSMVGAAGNVLGVKLTTDGDWDGTTADILVTVYVALWF